MDNKEFYKFNTLNDYYVRQKKKEIKNLEEKKEKYEREFEALKIKLTENNEALNKVKFENNLLKDQYNSVKRVLKERGIILDITNKNYSVREWDNLVLKLLGNKYAIVTKKGEELKVLDEISSSIFKECIEEEKFYSFIVIRVEGNIIKAQLRIKSNNSK